MGRCVSTRGAMAGRLPLAEEVMLRMHLVGLSACLRMYQRTHTSE